MSSSTMKVAYRPYDAGSSHGRKPRRATLTLLLALCYCATALGFGVLGIGAVLAVENGVSGNPSAIVASAPPAPQGWHTETISQNRLGAEFARQQANLVHRLSFR